MTNSEIKDILVQNEVRHLYHTNTVETSLSFLKKGGLLSRGACVDNKLPQSPQYTDELDKAYSIFYDIFFDSIEIQRRTGISLYGPVLFKYGINVLDTVEEGHIRITKMNPDKWPNTTSDSERYFQNIEELSTGFRKGDFGQHIMLTNQRQPLSFRFLKEIVLSDPKQEDNSIFDIAKKSIERVMQDSGIAAPLLVRDYSYGEKFFETYKDLDKLEKHFGLGGHR